MYIDDTFTLFNEFDPTRVIRADSEQQNYELARHTTCGTSLVCRDFVPSSKVSLDCQIGLETVQYSDARSACRSYDES